MNTVVVQSVGVHWLDSELLVVDYDKRRLTISMAMAMVMDLVLIMNVTNYEDKNWSKVASLEVLSVVVEDYCSIDESLV